MISNLIYFIHAFFSNEGNSLIPVLFILTFVMIIDYVTGMLAAKKESLEHPNSRKYGWNSKKSIKGIYKKVGYIVIVLVATITDYLIYILTKEIGQNVYTQTFFGILISIWLTINELISILENTGRMGAQLPKSLKKVLSELKSNIDDTHRTK